MNKEKAEKLLEFFDSCDCGYYDSGTKYFEVNVKRYHDGIDIEEFIKKYPKKYHNKLLEEFTESKIYTIYSLWLEYEASYLINDCIKGHCMNTSEKWWRENVEKKILIGENTGYQYIDEKESKTEKLNILEDWIKKDKEEIEMFSLVKDIYQLGRSGGHICFTINYNTSALEEIVSGYIEDKEDIKNIIEEAEDIKDKVLKLKTFIDNFNKNLNFKDELSFRIEEYMEELKEIEEEDIKIKKEAEKGITETMNSKLSELLLSKNEQVKRLAKGIYKEISK